MKRLYVTCILLPLAGIAGLAAPAGAGSIAQTKHNLAVTGEGENRICIFCHAPHNTSPATPLWNRALPNRVYAPYSSSTMEAAPGQPTHDSKLCLSCHDGTIGLGRTLAGGLTPRSSERLSGRANLSTDLSDDHPISFVYDGALASKDRELLDPARLALTPVRLDRYRQLQCTTCHESHYSPHPKLLVVDNTYSRLCTQCHQKTGWGASAHATSQAQWDGGGRDPWPHSDRETVAMNGCENCHASHAAGQPVRLLNLPEEMTCLTCHGGTVAKRDVAAEFRKPFRHQVETSYGRHEPKEAPASMPRHVECEDCHDPHAARDARTGYAGMSGVLAGVPGVSISGFSIPFAQHEYEVCFRCHADSPDAPAPSITRQILQTSVRVKFEESNPSSHPVAGPGRNPDVPSLISPLTETSRISCTDCHNSDTAARADGTGARGPHGSIWRYLLAREYRTADGTMESYQAYSLCYECHDQQSILGDESFPAHRLHVVDTRTPCSVCHDPHGISLTQGNPINNSNLINFDVSIVEPDPVSGILRFEDTGTRRGLCYLKCHDAVHSPREYGPGP